MLLMWIVADYTNPPAGTRAVIDQRWVTVPVTGRSHGRRHGRATEPIAEGLQPRSQVIIRTAAGLVTHMFRELALRELRPVRVPAPHGLSTAAGVASLRPAREYRFTTYISFCNWFYILQIASTYGLLSTKGEHNPLILLPILLIYVPGVLGNLLYLVCLILWTRYVWRLARSSAGHSNEVPAPVLK